MTRVFERESIRMLQRVTLIAGGALLLALLLTAYLSLVMSPDATWTARAVLAGYGILAVVRPDVALLVTAALIGFGGILSHLFGIPTARATEVLVAMSLGGLLLRAFPRESVFRRALASQISPPIVLFAIAAVASAIVWLRVEQTESDYASAFTASLFRYVARGYFSGPGDFGLVVSTAVVLEGLALYVVVGALCRVNASFFERCLRMFALGGAALGAMSIVRLAEIHLRDPNAVAALRASVNGLRISPQIPDYIAAGSYFSLCWVIVLALAVASAGRRLLWLAAGGLLTAALYLTGSRSVIAAALMGLLVLGLTAVRLRSTAARAVVIAALLAVGVMVASYPRLIGRDVGGELAKRSLLVRVELAKASFGIIAARPLFGVGTDRYHLWSSRLASPKLNAWFPARKSAHNDFLRIGAELGLVGLAFFLWILAAAARRIVRALRTANDTLLAGLAGGLVAFLVTSVISNPLMVRDVSYTFWIALGLAVAWSTRGSLSSGTTVPPLVQPEATAAPSSRRWKLTALAAVLLALSIPFRARQELATVDASRLTYGLFAWESDPRTGKRFRWSGANATFFVDGTARLVDMSVGGVELPSGSRREVEIRIDGEVANRVAAGPGWQDVRIQLPSVPSPHPRRVDLRVSPAWVPAEEFPESGDRRVLGIKVGEITVVADPNLDHAGLGVSEWQRHADGPEYRAAAADSTVFARAGVGSISIPLRAISPDCCAQVELRLDGELANIVSVGADRWQRVLLVVPPQRDGPAFLRIDVHVVAPRPAPGDVLMIGKVDSR